MASMLLLFGRKKRTILTLSFSLVLLLCLSISIKSFSPSTNDQWTRKQRRRTITLPLFAVAPVNGDTAETKASPAPVNGERQQQRQGQDNDTDGEKGDDFIDGNSKIDIFSLVAQQAAACLYESDLKRDAKQANKPGQSASGATNWIDDASAYRLRSALSKLKLMLPDERRGIDRDEASSWIRWMRASPTPMIINLSNELRTVANETLNTKFNMDLMDETTEEFLPRLGCRLIILPSGMQLDSPLSEAPGSMIYGRLLFGGVTRYRYLPTSSGGRRRNRKTGERTQIMQSKQQQQQQQQNGGNDDSNPVWIQYGGGNRMYEGVDIGPAALLEVVVMPRHQQETFDNMMTLGTNMAVGKIMWTPQQMFGRIETTAEGNKNDNTDDDDDKTEEDLIRGYTPVSLSGKERNNAFQSDFQSAVGGLQPQIDAIVRRVLDGRVIRPAEDDSIVPVGESDGTTSTNGGVGGDSTTAALAIAAMEAEELALLGLTPVRGLLMYGPPGCGKTALAREISRALRARAPKIVSAPELLDRWVGGSEKLVRALFADAEAELAACNGDATRSALHVIVIDEIDAVFRKRSTAEDSGEATRSSVVNQILAKLDGVNAIPNVLLIGMTNRRELLDEALLRPGRLEVQIEIPKPDKEGRREILQIHFEALRRKGRLSRPLCCAIDGIPSGTGGWFIDEPDEPTSFLDESTAAEENEKDVVGPGRKRRAMKRAINRVVDSFPVSRGVAFDLAADYATAGFSGADIAGLVRCAGSIALARARKAGTGIDSLLITLEDVKEALLEVKK